MIEPRGTVGPRLSIVSLRCRFFSAALKLQQGPRGTADPPGIGQATARDLAHLLGRQPQSSLIAPLPAPPPWLGCLRPLPATPPPVDAGLVCNRKTGAGCPMERRLSGPTAASCRGPRPTTLTCRSSSALSRPRSIRDGPLPRGVALYFDFSTTGSSLNAVATPPARSRVRMRRCVSVEASLSPRSRADSGAGSIVPADMSLCHLVRHQSQPGPRGAGR